MRSSMTPFPINPVLRREAHVKLVAAAPELMKQVSEQVSSLKSVFPGAKLTFIHAGDIEFGRPPENAWEIDDDLVRRVANAERKRNPPPEVVEAKRIDKKASNSRKKGK